MLITVSGMVGSGKTTAVNHVMAAFGRSGQHAASWRFQYLPCFAFLRRSKKNAHREVARGVPSVSPRRWTGYRRKRLTLARTLGYAARILAFQIYRLTARPPGIVVVNRYFYDNMVHYSLTSASERAYARVLSRLIPKPDVAIMVAASKETIAARRPEYAEEYLSSVAEAYSRLGTLFPELIEVRTDPGSQPSALERIEALLKGPARGSSQR